ncbi:heavy metal translocating P-type ATPase [Neisseriaceae bacterium TC5R-5]|nr:heavy metal translocating P-type ATPase [Neisseriaceae bacterium TC5R-5]
MRLHIQAMDCPTEGKLIEKVLTRVPGVMAMEFNFIERVLLLRHDQADLSALKKTLVNIGMPAVELTPDVSTVLPAAHPSRRANLLLASAGVLAFASEAVAWFSGAEQTWLMVLLAGASILAGGLPTLRKGWVALSNVTLNIYFLMSVAVLGAILIGQWPEAAMVLFLFAIAERLEAMSLAKAGEAVRALMALAPELAWVWQQGDWQAQAVAKVAVGTRVRVRPGERVPVDGVIRVGHSAFNEAPITGESLPLDKGPGSQVFAGSINGGGLVEIETTSVASGSVLARIIATVRHAQASKAPTQRFIDRFAVVYTPIVVVAALLFAILVPSLGWMPWSQAIYTALVMLVIACPCALVIATPVTLVSSLAATAKYGVLVKGGGPLEMAAKVDTICFDKTGTITQGEPQVTEVIALSELDKLQVLAWAAALDAHSTHPLAKAVLVAAAKQGVSVPEASQLSEQAGRGVQGRVAGRDLALGSSRLAKEQGAWSEELQAVLGKLEAKGQGTLVLLDGTRVLGVLAVADVMRAEAAATLTKLAQQGIATVMLSGDNPQAVQAVAAQAGIAIAYGGLLPEEKLAHILVLQQAGHTVAMVGDGVNDAPALAQADLGIAMGAAGSDSALETAGVALMEDRLAKLPGLLSHARRTIKILRVNIIVALAIKALFFALALLGLASLWMAVFADVGASLLVMVNGLRLALTVRRED